MADIKISELTAVSSLNNGDLVEVSQVNALAPSGYTSLKATMTDLGEKVNTDIEYTTDLADFTDKTTLGAIKETANLIPKTAGNLPLGTDFSDPTSTAGAIGDLSSLTTTDKTSIVGAVNEVNGKIKHEVLTATTNPNGLIAYDHTSKRIINAICTSNNYVLFQIQSYVIVKHYNTFAVIANESVTFDIYYI